MRQVFARLAKLAGLAVAAGSLTFAVPAAAQFSAGYKFLEAVKKRDGQAATDALQEPGSTLVNARDISSGEGALHIVVARRDLPWLRFLLQNGANPDLLDNRGTSPLELAVSLRFFEGVEELAGAGANVDETNATGETPLIVATHLRDEELAKILLKAGANPDRADNSGRSARDYAKLDGRKNPVLATIEAADADRPKAADYGPPIR